ncbi:MAG TPA: M23 family metallopeptidase [Solirubrobacteraceae bacterium]|nr:M23 family metallopeptidase [Solirubrobacteraceae bacterium]
MPNEKTHRAARCRAYALAALSLLTTATASVVPTAAHAQAEATGGGTAYEKPDVTAMKCGTGDAIACPQGHVLRLSGEGLSKTQAVLFLGGKGAKDDRRATPTEKSPHRVIVKVPTSAKSGPIRVIAATGGATGPSLKVLPTSRSRAVVTPAAVPAGADGIFPVQGKHDFGTFVNTFGGGRGHEGQDVLADCGTPLVAARGGTVQMNKFQANAGNYVVIQAADGTSQAYMHLRDPSPVQKGDAVVAGQPIGVVGQTGRASACHLHFEYWTAPGWYEGGKPIDPLPILQSWDTGSVLPAAATASSKTKSAAASGGAAAS